MTTKYSVEIEFLTKAIAALTNEDSEEAASCLAPVVSELKRINKQKAVTARALKEGRRLLINECNRLCGELGGPSDCTFAAMSTAELFTLRDELRAMKAGKPLDGDDPLRNPLDNLKLTPA